MKQVSTFFLRGIIVLIGLGILTLGGFLMIEIAKEMVDVMPVQYGLLPILLSVGLSLIPFFIALYHAWKLLNLVDKNKAFSVKSVTALKYIKNCALAIGILFVLCSPFLFMLAEGDDAPGVFAMGLIIIFASFGVAVFMAVLQRLFQNAVDIKKENDLTV